MKRFLALAWLAAVLLGTAHLAWRLHEGLAFRTDLMALLPREDRDPAFQNAQDRVSDALSRRIVVLVGHPERAQARAAAAELERALAGSGLVELTTGGFDKDSLQRLGALYFPYRHGLLAEHDRVLLQAGKAQDIALRALSQMYGPIGMADARLVQQDPFLLTPAFFVALPLPQSKLTLDDGFLQHTEAGMVWVLVSGRLTGEPFALDTQDRLSAAFEPTIRALAAQHPGLEVLRLGAVFYAKAGAEQALGETSAIGVASTIGTVLLVLFAFRALSPAWLSLLVIGVGVVMALSASLWAFGQLHVGALLFGVSLIGVAVDYSLQYCTEIYAPRPGDPGERLRRVLMGITLGTATTVIGYLTLFLAPFPGLHQIAVFSAAGLVSAWLTVVLWLPALDRSRRPHHHRRMLAWSGWFLGLWERHRRRCLGVLAVALLASGVGFLRLHTDDDVRRMQSLSPALVAQQERLQQLIGSSGGSQFLLVQAADEETALQREEALGERLRALVGRGVLAGFQSPAAYVPSAARQRDNRALIRRTLGGDLLREQVQRLGLQATPAQPEEDGPLLTLGQALAAGGPLGSLSMLVLEPKAGDQGVLHLVSLDGVADPPAVRTAVSDMVGVRFVDPAGEFSQLLGRYRNRALALLVISALLMAPLLAWRYGVRGGLMVMVPPILAAALAVGLRSLAGGAFTFFDAMALVLILSIGVDYAVFCAETGGDRKAVTMLAVSMAALTALMSFGLLAFSHVSAVHAFGASMAVGICCAFLLSPLARQARPRTGQSAERRPWAVIGERGTLWGLRLCKLLVLFGGKRSCMVVLWVAATYFYLSEAERRRHSLAFLRRAHAHKGLPPPGWWDGQRHYVSFAEKALDAFIAWARPERGSPLTVVNAEPIDALAARGKGGLLIVSHLGNAELCRARLTTCFSRHIQVLLHSRNAVHYTRILRAIRPEVGDHTIQVTEIGPDTAIRLKERIDRGEWIAIAGDRTPVLSNGRVSRVPFLGEPAPFSQGPYILAALMDCPVFLMFCLRDGAGYRVTFEPFAERVDLPRRDREAALAGYAARYAARLQYYCLQSPREWYNFYDFWS
jgi:predicted exporter/predicted LPLAT superfamily acyltransferase